MKPGQGQLQDGETEMKEITRDGRLQRGDWSTPVFLILKSILKSRNFLEQKENEQIALRSLKKSR